MSLAVDDDLNFLDGDDDDGSGFDASALLAEPILDDDSGEFGLSSGVESSGLVGGTPLSMPNNFNSNMVSQLKMQAMLQQQQQQQRPRQISFQQQQPQHLQNSFDGFNHNNNMNNSMSNMNNSMSNMNNSMSNVNNSLNNLSSSMGSMNHNMGTMNNNMSSMNNSMSNMNNSMSNMNNNMQLPQNQLLRNQPLGGIDSYMSMNDSNGMQVQESQQVVNLKMQELQQQIQQVQSQIQQVQFQSSQLEMQDSQNSASQNGMGNMNLPQNLLNSMGNMNAMNNMNLNTMNISNMNNMNNLNQMQNQQSPFGIQGMMNHSSGMDRRAPDRSFSAPVVQRSAGFGGNFMDQEQQRRPQKQPQGGTSLAAMAASLQPGGQGTAGQGTGGGPPGNVNEAMEKLCESMRRSAMSRSMVRQLSGRSAPTSRDMSRSKSGGLPRGTLGRNPSGRSVQRANSGTDSLRGGPIRRPTQDTKHRIQRDALSSSGGPPGRGVFRHKSSPQGALGGTTRLQIDDNNVGMF